MRRLLGGGAAAAAVAIGLSVAGTAKPDVPDGICAWCWWCAECWFIPMTNIRLEPVQLFAVGWVVIVSLFVWLVAREVQDARQAKVVWANQDVADLLAAVPPPDPNRDALIFGLMKTTIPPVVIPFPGDPRRI